MKKTLLLIILLSFLPFIFIFSIPLFFYTQDGLTHLAREGAFYKALQDGQLPVRWAGDLNYSYGMPLFDFVFQIPYLLTSLFIFLGFGLVNALKIITLLSYIISGIFMYLFAKQFFKDEKKALLVTIFYQFFPYRLVDMFVRGSVGEMYTFTFLPVLLYGTVLFFKKSTIKSSIIIAIGTAGIVLSHLATGAVFLAIAGIFVLLFSPQFKKSMLVFASMLMGLGLSAYYWIPALADHKYTYGSLFAKGLFRSNFAPFVNFFIPNFFNDPGLRTGNVPIQVGIFHMLAIISAIIFLIAGKKAQSNYRKLTLFCFGILFFSFFIMQPVSTFIWQKVPLFEQFQFPWRFLGAVGFATSMLSVYFLTISFLKKKVGFILLLILVIATTAVYWYPQLGFKKVDENYYWNYPLDTTYFGETNLIWSAGPASSYPKKRIEVIGGSALINSIKINSNSHTYTVIAKNVSTIVDHAQFFPGWKVFVDGQNVPIQFQDPNYRGEITFIVPQGKHSVKVRFAETGLRMIADIISVFFILFIVLFLILRKFRIGEIGKKLHNR